MAALGGLRFTPPGKPVMPPPQSGPLDGAYWGSVTRSTLGMDGMLQMDIQGRTFVFWREGWVHDGARKRACPRPRRPSRSPAAPQGEGDGGTYQTGGWSTTTANIKGSGFDPPDIGGVGAHSTSDGTTGRYEIKGGVIRYFPADGSRGRVALAFRVGEDSIFIGTQPLK